MSVIDDFDQRDDHETIYRDLTADDARPETDDTGVGLETGRRAADSRTPHPDFETVAREADNRPAVTPVRCAKVTDDRMRCNECSKFVSFEEGDPEIDLSLEDDTKPVVTGTARIVLNCGECSTELKEANFDVEIDLSELFNSDGDKADWSFELVSQEGTMTDRMETTDKNGKPIKNPRFMRHMYGIDIGVDIRGNRTEDGKQVARIEHGTFSEEGAGVRDGGTSMSRSPTKWGTIPGVQSVRIGTSFTVDQLTEQERYVIEEIARVGIMPSGEKDPIGHKITILGHPFCVTGYATRAEFLAAVAAAGLSVAEFDRCPQHYHFLRVSTD